MDAVDLIILALRIALVALLYLFLVMVLRFAARGLSTDATGPVRSDRHRLKLVVLEPGTSGLPQGHVLEIDDGVTLGRSAGRADVVVGDPSVSAEHARVQRARQGWVVSDLGSTNGTRVNDAHAGKRTPLLDGDVLVIGAVRLQVLAE